MQGEPDSARRGPLVRIRCSCGKTLSAPLRFASKSVNCPNCGTVNRFPSSDKTINDESDSYVENKRGKSAQKRQAVFWTVSTFLVIASVSFFYWFLQAQMSASANHDLSQVVSAAKTWLKQGSPEDGKNIELRLTMALDNKFVTQREPAERLLKDIQQHIAEQAEESRVKMVREQMVLKFKDAKKSLDDGDILTGIGLLKDIISNPDAADKSAVIAILEEAEIAISDKFTFEMLINLDDAVFETARASAQINDGKVTHPALLAARSESVQRCLPDAIQQREVNNRREAERISALEADRRRMEEKDRELKRQELESIRRKKLQITAKAIEVFGPEMNGQTREMLCKFIEIDNDYLDSFEKTKQGNYKSTYVSFVVQDTKGDRFTYAFANKSSFGRFLLSLKKGDSINIIGTVTRFRKTNTDFKYGYAMIIDQIEKVP